MNLILPLFQRWFNNKLPSATNGFSTEPDVSDSYDTKHLSDQGTFTPVGAQGEVPWNPPLIKPLYHLNFAMKFAPYLYALLETLIPEKKLECCTVLKWRPNNRFLFRVIFILAKIWKTTFPKDLSN